LPELFIHGVAAIYLACLRGLVLMISIQICQKVSLLVSTGNNNMTDESYKGAVPLRKNMENRKACRLAAGRDDTLV
jgi:hypothetical protein